MNRKLSMHRAAASLLLVLMLFAVLPAKPAGATVLNIASVATGTWEATAWPSTMRSGTISVIAGDVNVVGVGTAFLTELSVGNILRTTGNVQIGTVASITSNTTLTLVNLPSTTRTNIAYLAQGVGPADNASISAGHTVTIAARPVQQTGTVTVNAGGTLAVSNAGTIFNMLVVNGTVNGTSGNAFGALTVNNGGVVNAGGTGSTTAYVASSLTINGGGTVNLSRNFTVTGATSVAGTITFSSTTVTARAMVFGGPVTLQHGATWSEPASGNGDNNTYDFQHNLTNNTSVLTASPTSPHTFSGTARTLSGSTNTSIPRVVISGTYTNNGILTVGTNLSGTGVLTNGASGTLTLGGTAAINALTNLGTTTKINEGPTTIPLANFINNGTLNLNGTGTFVGITNNGTVNLNSSGLINDFDNASATSVLNIYDLTPVPHFTNLIVTVPGNTVNYAGAGNQTVKPITYSNLIFSGADMKFITMPNGSVLTTGTLSIAPTGTVKAFITGPNLVVDTLRLGGFGKNAGTWGSSASAAENTDDNFFALTTGYLNAQTDGRDAQTISFTSAPPADAVVGGATYTPAATATSGLPVTFAIDASAAAICSISAGVVSFDATGTCLINANQAGNENYKPAPQVQQSFIVHTEATVHISIGGDEMVGSPVTMLSGQGARQSFPGISAGPVEIESDTPVMAAERVVYKVNGAGASFTELMGLPNNQLDTTYWLPWYNNVELDTQLRIANVSGSTATIRIYIGEEEMTGSPFTLGAGESTRQSFPGVSAGPVKIESDVNIVDAERVVYKVNGVGTSFTEMMALPDSQLDTTFWFPWYNNVELDTQLRFANVSGSTATVRIYVGREEMTGSPFTLAAGESTRKSFAGINNGPVQIVSTQNIVAAERVVYKVNEANTSFTETMGLPDGQLNTSYWFPWYNNKDLDTQLRIANISGSTATVQVYIGGVEMTGSPFDLGVGESTRKSFANVSSGPVQILSNRNIVAAERVVYKVNGVGTSFSEMMGLPDDLLDIIYWLPWYNNATPELDTQLRFAAP